MNDIYTADEIKAKIIEIDEQILAAQKTMSYQLDTGQGSQKVTRQNLNDLYNSREYWLRKYENAVSGGGLISMEWLR